jgi:hypothetical protein
LARTIDRIVHGWKDKGTIIDARGKGRAKIMKEHDLPYGDVVVLTREGDQVRRSHLPEEKVGSYVAEVLKGVSQGSSASAADAEAARAVGVGSKR